MATDLHCTMNDLHAKKKITHGDVSNSNIMVTINNSTHSGIPTVTSLDDLHVVFIDFGHSKPLPNTDNAGHTSLYGSRYFFDEDFSSRMQAEVGDLFQAPTVHNVHIHTHVTGADGSFGLSGQAKRRRPQTAKIARNGDG